VQQRVERLEREPATVGERLPDRGERPRDVVVGEEHLEDMTGHDHEVELVIERDGPEVAVDPVHIGGNLRLVQHRRRRVKADESPGVPVGASPPEQPARAAADVQHGFGRHDEIQVEVVAWPPRVHLVIENREARIGVIIAVLGLKHRASVANGSPEVAPISRRSTG
jgi:hypothetical protein